MEVMVPLNCMPWSDHGVTFLQCRGVTFLQCSLETILHVQCRAVVYIIHLADVNVHGSITAESGFPAQSWMNVRFDIPFQGVSGLNRMGLGSRSTQDVDMKGN